MIDDTKKRRDENGKTELKKNKYISLDKNKEFDKKIIDSVADSIIDQSKTSDEVDDILIKRLIENEKYKKELIKDINDKLKKDWNNLSDKQKKNLTIIINKFFR